MKRDFASISALPMGLTIFPDLTARQCEPVELPWSDFGRMILSELGRPSKAACRLIKLATFGDRRTANGCLRNDQNMISISGVEGDYDGGEMTVDEARAALAKWQIMAFIVTTAGHTSEHPRWRVFAPLSRAHSVNERRYLVGLLNAALGGALEPESFVKSQAFYFGRVQGVPFEYAEVDGLPLDEAALFLEPVYTDDRAPDAKDKAIDVDVVIPAKAPRGASPEYVDQLLKGIAARHSNDPRWPGRPDWLRVGMGLHHDSGGAEWALHAWDVWSADLREYKGPEDVQAAWDSLGKRTTGAVAALDTLEWMAGMHDSPRSPEAQALWEDLVSREFDAVEPTHDSTPLLGARPFKFRLLAVHDFARQPAGDWIVKGVLPKAALGVIYGESGSGKSFLALELVMAIACGTEWRGRRVKQGRVVYVAAEGATGMRSRFRAFERHSGIDLSTVAIQVLDGTPNLLTDDDTRDLIDTIREGGPVSVIVIDTLAQVTPGGNENSSESMGAVLSRCRQLHEATGALILLIHHAGKTEGKGPRGWSGLHGAADVEIEVTVGPQRADGAPRQHLARLSKQKDGEDGLKFPFVLVKVDLGVDADGEAVGSCVVVASAATARQADRRPTGTLENEVLKVVRELTPFGDTVAFEAVVEEARRRLAPTKQGGRDSRRYRITRALGQLQVKEHLSILDGKIQISRVATQDSPAQVPSPLARSADGGL